MWSLGAFALVTWIPYFLMETGSKGLPSSEFHTLGTLPTFLYSCLQKSQTKGDATALVTFAHGNTVILGFELGRCVSVPGVYN